MDKGLGFNILVSGFKAWNLGVRVDSFGFRV
jgi:hypothetical protein